MQCEAVQRPDLPNEAGTKHSEDTCLKRFTGRSISFELKGASGNVIDGLFEDLDKQEVEAAYSEDNTLKGIYLP